MTVASEIQRLQWAKADIKTAIENKWITVPSSATLDEYHNYVDQIITWWWIGWLKLYPHLVWAPRAYDYITSTPISWEENGIYYWLCWIIYASTSWDDIYTPVCVFKKTPNTDIQYLDTSWEPYIDNWVRKVLNFIVYKNWSNIRGFSFGNYNHTYEQYRYTQCLQFDWDIVNNTLSQTNLWHWTYWDYNPLNYWADLTWYTQISWSTRVDSVWLTTASGQWYDLSLYLTLK